MTRKVSRRDRRARELELSAAGADLLRRIEPSVQKAQTIMLAGLSEKEADQLVSLLNKITKASNNLSRAPQQNINEAEAG